MKRVVPNTHFYLIILFVISILAGCSSPHTPAPIVTLNTSIPQQNVLTEISGDTYVVTEGDTLFSIAFYSGNDYRDIAKYNEISKPYNIFPGQKLRLVASTSAKNTSKNYTKVRVDRTKGQGYRESERKKHRIKSNKNASRPNGTDSKKIRWSWPAEGSLRSAVVGSDGSNRGLDITGQLGSTIRAAADGKVVYAGNALKGYGNLIIVKHKNDYLSAYAHNQKILVDEQVFVRQGQEIAHMGRSENGQTMLHFEIRKKGKSLDPLKFLPKAALKQ